MLEESSVELVCPSKSSFMGDYGPYLLILLNHPDLGQDEKFVFLWLLIQCDSQSSDSCIMSYGELSDRLDKPPKKVHWLLFRLKAIGFLEATLPFWYGELTEEMISIERTLKPVLLSERDIQYQLMIKKRYENQTLIWPKYNNAS